MTTIKTPLEILSEVGKSHVSTFDLYTIKGRRAFKNILSAKFVCEAIEAYHNQFDCIDKQTAIDFCQSILKDFSTIEVTQETLNKFLNKK